MNKKSCLESSSHRGLLIPAVCHNYFYIKEHLYTCAPLSKDTSIGIEEMRRNKLDK